MGGKGLRRISRTGSAAARVDWSFAPRRVGTVENSRRDSFSLRRRRNGREATQIQRPGAVAPLVDDEARTGEERGMYRSRIHLPFDGIADVHPIARLKSMLRPGNKRGG